MAAQISAAEGAFRRSKKAHGLGFIAGPAFRKLTAPTGANEVQRFLKRNKALLSKFFIFATGGTYQDCLRDQAARKTGWAPALAGLRGHQLADGKLGGLVQMAALAEKRVTRRSGPLKAGPLTHLMLLVHPEDREESYPESRALVRSAIRNDVLFLPTWEAARLWAEYEGVGKRQPENRSKESLALIAHDGKKLDMCRWVVDHRHRLRAFARIFTTGTTGEWVERFLLAAGLESERVDPRFSGPKGGDVQIGEALLRQKIQHVVFFVDPMTSHPHEADIQALTRICLIPKLAVNLRLTESAATSWIEAYPK